MSKLTEIILHRKGLPSLTMQINPRFPHIGLNAWYLRDKLRSYTHWAMTEGIETRPDWWSNQFPNNRFVRVPFKIEGRLIAIWGFDSEDERFVFMSKARGYRCELKSVEIR